MLLRTFFWSMVVTVITLVAAGWIGGIEAFVLVTILAVLEVSLSFDNAVINAKVLERMSKFWQRLFLTVGVAIAVFGMRLVFPLLLVAATAKIGPIEALRLARFDEARYEQVMLEAHPSIAAFGGVFLLLIFLDFVFEEREITWLKWLEEPLAKIGKLDQLSVVITLTALVVAAVTIAKNPAVVLTSGLLGVLTYLVVNGLGEMFHAEGSDENDDDEGKEVAHATAPARQSSPSGSPVRLAVGKAAFFLFLYLEVLDASFSFDGVVGAFAITSKIFIIAAGLGIGAMYVRSITVYLVNKGTLREFVYLEHGAHWAIGALAVILLLSIKFHIDEIITGLIGVVLIVAAYLSSLVRNRRARAADGGGSKQELAGV